ncbi:carbohydrate ABC transporter permease [Actinospica durhamensis]|uniref:Carbohydrate ABC transporter permease n=1 Tax=Actinospica durhamensis TaxID=1508375 RepID=A0A941EUM5_9ACTN|nr:carbohydrate ABC transporter permease [Actinospica durhamensis]
MWQEKPSLFGQGGKTVAIVVISILVLYPFVAVLGTSLSSETEIAEHGGLVLWPAHPTLNAYRMIFTGSVVTRAVVVSLAITLAGTAFSLLITVPMAYALAQRRLVGRRFFLMAALFTMMFNPGIIANFLLVTNLGLSNSYWSLILPSLVSAFNLVILRSFFMGLPQELYDAASIDGAGDLRMLLRLVIPLSKGVIAVVTLFTAVGYWNEWFNALLYLNDSTKWPLAYVLRFYVDSGQSLVPPSVTADAGVAPQAVSMATVVVSIVPIVALYPFLQRYFTRGVLTGAVKG